MLCHLVSAQPSCHTIYESVVKCFCLRIKILLKSKFRISYSQLNTNFDLLHTICSQLVVQFKS